MPWQLTRHRQHHTERPMNFQPDNYSGGSEVSYIMSTLKGRVEEDRIKDATVENAGEEHELLKRNPLLSILISG